MNIIMKSLRAPHSKLYIGYTTEELQEGIIQYTIGIEGTELEKNLISVLPAIQQFTLNSEGSTPLHGALLTTINYFPEVHIQYPLDENLIEYTSANLHSVLFPNIETVIQLNTFLLFYYGLFFSTTIEERDYKKALLSEILSSDGENIKNLYSKMPIYEKENDTEFPSDISTPSTQVH